ncbi:MAG TPA: hypothetical protein GX707_19890 [Epulopiscium sp.]|nr:hypothetical protein [Candidatus Epulonipiscium sp.]
MKDRTFYMVIVAFVGVIVMSIAIFLGIIVVNLRGMGSNSVKALVKIEEGEEEGAEAPVLLDGEQVAELRRIREIIDKKDIYIDKRVTIGPVVVTNNDGDKKAFNVKESIREGQVDAKQDGYIEVNYNKLPAAEKWYTLTANKESVIYVKGIVKQHSNSSIVYIEADTITYDQERPLPATNNYEGVKDDEWVSEITPSIETGTVTDSQYPQGNIRYVPYTNERYGFFIEYPDIFNDKRLSDNGDGISLENAQMDTRLKVYGSNNVNEETAIELYEEDVRNAFKLLYKFQKDNWYVISWEEGEDGFYKKTVVGEGSINTFIMGYPKLYDPEYSGMVEHLFESFDTPEVDELH